MPKTCGGYGRTPDLKKRRCLDCGVYESCLETYEQIIQIREGVRPPHGFHLVSRREQKILEKGGYKWIIEVGMTSFWSWIALFMDK